MSSTRPSLISYIRSRRQEFGELSEKYLDQKHRVPYMYTSRHYDEVISFISERQKSGIETKNVDVVAFVGSKISDIQNVEDGDAAPYGATLLMVTEDILAFLENAGDRSKYEDIRVKLDRLLEDD